jgi:UDP-N-acetylglucosamine acyltransferase
MPTNIHPTAVVSAQAEIGEDCQIGPYCVIGPRVKLGAGCLLHSHVVIDGNTSLGPGCRLFPFACIGMETQDLKFRGGETRVEIGADTTMREYVTIHQPTTDGGLTKVGDHCHLLAHCHVAHDCLLGNGIIMSNTVNLAGHVIVEDNVIIGGVAGVHQFVRIGTGVMVGATAKVVQDVMPYCLAEGNPASLVTVNKIGMQRRGNDEASIRAVTQAFKTFFRANLPLEAAVAAVESEFGGVPEVRRMLEFVAQSERGLMRCKASRKK